jgi:hypothetical protein
MWGVIAPSQDPSAPHQSSHLPPGLRSQPHISSLFGVLNLFPQRRIVDLEHQLIEVWTPEATLPAVERQRVSGRTPARDWTPAGASGPLTIELEELIRPV